MATNNDKWFVGQVPVSKGFVGETQVYPSGGGGIDSDAHIFVINGDTTTTRILPVMVTPSYVSINGVEVTPKKSYTTSEMKPNDVVEFIGDWETTYPYGLAWMGEIRNIGLNSVTGKRHQVKQGNRAFHQLNRSGSFTTEHPGLNYLDTSNITTFHQGFGDAKGRCDASGWDTSNITSFDSAFRGVSANSFYPGGAGAWNTSKATNMDRMFYQNYQASGEAGKPALDLSEWCVKNFYSNSTFAQYTKWPTQLLPVWGTCPRGEA